MINQNLNLPPFFASHSNVNCVQKKLQFDAKDINVIIIDQINNQDLF